MNKYKKESWPVTKKAINRHFPGAPIDACFRCNAKLGDQHNADCVHRKRVVNVTVQITYPILVPEHWDAEMIEFHRNESSWCAGSAFSELSNWFEFMDENDLDPCARFKFEYHSEGGQAEFDSAFTHLDVSEMEDSGCICDSCKTEQTHVTN